MRANSHTLIVIAGFFLICAEVLSGGSARQVWVPDNRDGTYTNPIIYADYSDPDVIRVGDDFYMTSSSFNCSPGLPILHSRDLVNWTIIGHALQRPVPEQVLLHLRSCRGSHQRMADRAPFEEDLRALRRPDCDGQGQDRDQWSASRRLG